MTTIYFDFETGGILPEHPSIQLAAIAVDDSTGKELSAFDQKIVFDASKCDPEALLKNHYNPDAWKDAVSPMVAAGRFSKFLDAYKCIQMVSKKSGRPYYVAKGSGYNAASFDWPRLRELFGQAFLPMSYQIRDVLQRVIFHFDENGNPPEDLKLSTVCKHFGIETDGAHDALVDVRMTAKLYHKIRASKTET